MCISLETYPPSKNPRLFDIDLHIDDSEGVRQEGEQYGFDVLVISPEDAEWAIRTKDAVAKRNRR